MPPLSHDGGFVVQFAVAGIVSLAAAIALLRAAPSNRSARRALRFASGAFLLAAAAVLVSGSVFEQKRRASHDVLRAAIPDALPPEERFVTSAACKGCHPSQYHSWHDSYHRTMTQAATPAAIVGRFDDVRLASRNRSYHLTRRGDEFWVSMVDPDWEQDHVERGVDPTTLSNPPRVDARVVMTTGSHHMQTYWVGSRRDDRLFNLPFVWLNGDGRWAPREDVFLRPPQFARQFGTWHNNCVECHCVAGEQGFDTNAKTFDPTTAELGIACEACHGPGEAHIRANQDLARRYRLHFSDAPDTTIVNPARLSPRLATYVCAQCHSMNIFKTDPRLPGERYRAGGDLLRTKMILRTSDRMMSPAERLDWPRLERHIGRQTPTYVEERFWPDGMARVSGRETNGMVESACFQENTLSCLSCHSMHSSDPDDQLAERMEGDDACFQCHAEYRDRVEEHTHHKAGSSGSLCYNCHMPHTTYGLLKAIRSHLIDSPSVAKDLETGRTNACNSCHLDKTIAWTAEHLTRWYDQTAPALSQEESSISETVLRLLKGDAAQRAIAAWHLGWAPAQEASSTVWIAPVLAQLLDDPYACVRYIAHRSLTSLPGYEYVPYDFVGDAEQRAAARRAIETIFAAMSADGSRELRPEVLADASGRLDFAALAMLASRRDDRIVDLRE
jgi:predicted CXXCH cytochrome family protein